MTSVIAGCDNTMTYHHIIYQFVSIFSYYVGVGSRLARISVL